MNFAPITTASLTRTKKLREKSKKNTKQVKTMLEAQSDETILNSIKDKIDFIPVRDLAKSLQISRKTLANICKQNNIEIKSYQKTKPTPNYRITWVSDDILKEIVWQIPISRLAITWGVSDKAIAMRCQKRGIPIPGRGYWKKKEFGKL